ncbi:hypothetical protein [uncultured Nitratireductor sp.]|uniref:hypothetical protein n=1 Tax=uncultured Nitratireductor sp. TaxID=520953 RepID=UPI0026318425|nr:hypothetical protein [uncultured Nitratireductor sp.]
MPQGRGAGRATALHPAPVVRQAHHEGYVGAHHEGRVGTRYEGCVGARHEGRLGAHTAPSNRKIAATQEAGG